MTDTTPTDGTLEAPAVAPPVGDPPSQADEPSDSDWAALQKELSKTRKEAASYRTKLAAYEQASQTELEKAQNRNKELEESLKGERSARQKMAVQAMAIASARKLQFRDPDLATRLISADEVEFGDDGNPQNVEKLLAALAKDHPALVNGTTPDYGAGPRGEPVSDDTDMNKRIRQAVGR